MNRTRFLFLVLLLPLVWVAPVQAEADHADYVVISELSTGSASSATQEFVELYNPTDEAISLDGWYLQYRPAGTTSSWGNRTSSGIHGVIPANGFFLLATTNYLTPDANFSSGMAASGGSLRVVDADSNVVDTLGWGTAVEYENSPAAASAAGGSIERLPGITNETGGNGIDADDNASDFRLRTTAQPQSTTSDTEVPGEVLETPTVIDQPAPTQTPEEGEQTQAPAPVPTPTASPGAPVINELFIDPASPLTDAKDEFIELYNPYTTPISLSGYVLKTGSNFRDTYKISSVTIAGGGFALFYSRDTKLSLTNTKGAAQLVDASGNVVDQSAEYDGSMTGFSFSRFGDDWQWSQSLTPGSVNVLVMPVAATSKAAVKQAKATKVAKAKTAKKAASTKATATKVKAAAVKDAKAAAAILNPQSSGLAARWLIIGLASLTIGYAIYEFRYDLQNYYVRAKRKLGTWRTPR